LPAPHYTHQQVPEAHGRVVGAGHQVACGAHCQRQHRLGVALQHAHALQRADVPHLCAHRREGGTQALRAHMWLRCPGVASSSMRTPCSVMMSHTCMYEQNRTRTGPWKAPHPPTHTCSAGFQGTFCLRTRTLTSAHLSQSLLHASLAGPVAPSRRGMHAHAPTYASIPTSGSVARSRKKHARPRTRILLSQEPLNM